ncbi:HPF/RaiA family ribosome-associated protein [Thiovibrio frasassiensis]|uniref:HPF/RaiA family ribosome-associated protein n=1 Tax=Thiovibrio frasassiensis TaxID=2984131 RepID=A0A9X4MJJ8_9BACT|nr:HPF/RaiA family ribosome-associated protein [Thiovibrio frasassiensis]MDG4476698.1 HPF/RaiA family ribosome-associated protein [Thiovibrio frasassiensis]
MQVPLQITFRNMTTSEALESYIRERAEKLDHICDTIVSCRVVVEAPPKHQRKGGLFHASIDISLPHETIVINREPDLHKSYHDAHVVVRDVFDTAQRKLRDFVSRQKGEVKAHEEMPQGTISELYPYEDYGRILTGAGDDIYFHRNSLINADFGDLVLGAEVRFVEEQGNDGPQASSVRVVKP